MSRSSIGVMHVTDTLEAGGAEQVAVNLANLLPRERFRAHLCTTRRDGRLADALLSDVGRLRLGRRWRFDRAAIGRMVAYIREHEIEILHAHGSSIFTASVAALFAPHPLLVWHDHYGLPLEERAAWIERPLAKRARAVIAVSQPLAEWSRRSLAVADDRVWYIPNFVCLPNGNQRTPHLPGEKGYRIVCVANLRPQKDHLTLLRAMADVARQIPAAHLLLVGSGSDEEYQGAIKAEVARLGLEGRVSLLGERSDVAAILRASDVGVLSSLAEGLPLALIEYAHAGLASVATRVGQCAEVLDEGRAGLLVPAQAPRELGQALVRLLKSPIERIAFGEMARRRARELYSARSIIERICRVYDTVLMAKNGRGR
ncbi:MAG TPA: glycosyltransferase [Pyrinomonadaceae bacterium]|jgi:glycosyltransferase involved in cell wall biosynthesis